jgi:hypothetical protein
MSNIVDENTGRVPVPLRELHVIEREGVRIGLIGLVEKSVLLPSGIVWAGRLTYPPVNGLPLFHLGQLTFNIRIWLRSPSNCQEGYVIRTVNISVTLSLHSPTAGKIDISWSYIMLTTEPIACLMYVTDISLTLGFCS